MAPSTFSQADGNGQQVAEFVVDAEDETNRAIREANDSPLEDLSATRGGKY